MLDGVCVRKVKHCFFYHKCSGKVPGGLPMQNRFGGKAERSSSLTPVDKSDT